MAKPSPNGKSPGGAEGGVRTLLRVEGAALFAASVIAYAAWVGAPWWFFAVLFLAPDLSFLAFIGGRRVGAMAYNAAHATIGPIVVVLAGLSTANPWVTGAGLVWAAHIGIDRALGYGLRYPHSFERTHLGPVGSLKKAAGG